MVPPSDGHQPCKRGAKTARLRAVISGAHVEKKEGGLAAAFPAVPEELAIYAIAFLRF
jgi:hypothetical protein